MVQCQNRECGYWQHRDCLGIASHGPQPANFHCEDCRARLADPFWEPMEALLPAVKLKPLVGRPPVTDQYGVHPTQHTERTIFLSDAQLGAAKADAGAQRIQLGCLLIQDEVPFRYHWPRNISLKVNSAAYRPYARNLGVNMGINQRDDAASIASLCVRGRNMVEATAVDSGQYVLMVQRSRRRSLAQVQALMAAAESLEQAVARVKRQVTGGGGEDGITISTQVVSLKDPMSGQRMQVAARFSDASGLQSFDLDSLLSIAERNRKWQDPTTLANSTIKELQRDVYMQHVLACTAASPDDTQVEINDQGEWRPLGSEGRWWSITQEVSEVQQGLRKAGTGAHSSAATAKAGVKAEEGEMVEDSETDEEEELRKAAAAVQPAAAALAGQKRRHAEPEVISLVSSDEDEPGRQPPPPPGLGQLAGFGGAGTAPNGGGATAGGPIRIRLTPRSQQQQRLQGLQQQQQQQWEPPMGMVPQDLPSWNGATMPSAMAPPAGMPVLYMGAAPMGGGFGSYQVPIMNRSSPPEGTLSQQAQRELEDLRQNPQVYDALNVDDWLN